MQYYLGIDSGTQSTKALIVSESGKVCGRGASPYDLIEGLPQGHAEQHPQTWLDATIQATQQAVKDADIDPALIAGIGVSGQQHGFVPLDADMQAIRPAKLWCDTSTAPQCQAIMKTIGGEKKTFDLTGNLVLPGFTASKILWLKENETDNYAKLKHVLLPHNYLNWWLTGQLHMEYGDASGTAMMDVRNLAWCSEVINAIDPAVKDMLPQLTHPREACGTLTEATASALGLRPGIIVSSGGGDNMMSAIGTGNVVEGVVTASLGTSGTIVACSNKPITDDRGEIAAFCDSTGKWLPLLCTMNVTVASEMTKEIFDLDNEKLNSLAESVPAGSEGLLLLPYFAGERCPNVPNGRGVWFGATRQNNTPAHFCRAAMEGAVLGMNYGLRRMREMGIEPTEIRLVGGGSKSPLWRQIVADVFDTPVVCTAEPEGAAFGGAAQARWAHLRQQDAATPIESVTSEWVEMDESTRCTPSSKAVEVYRKSQALQDALSSAMRNVFDTI